MRISRLVVAAVSSLGIAAVPVPVAAVVHGAAATAAATPAIVLQPGAAHARGVSKAPPTTAFCEKHYKIACYEPTQVRRAYNLGPLLRKGINGKGQTIVIVDPFGSPTIGHDLAVFDKTFHLAAPPSLKVIRPGLVPPYNPNNSDMVGWAGETTLDVEWAHTMAPRASILLVETPVSETEGTVGFPRSSRPRST